MAESTESAQIWDRLYREGHSLWYPYEVAVRLVRHHLGREGFQGVILDHGCGSGNHLEFFTRLGLRSHGTDVASGALDVVRARFAGAKLPCPPLSHVDPMQPLAGQLPAYDHVFAWGSLHYDAKPRVLAALGDLIAGLPKGGAFLWSVPSSRDIVHPRSEPMADGSRRITKDVSGQVGAIVTIPESPEELRSWIPGIDVRDLGTFGWTLQGQQVEYYFVYGVRS